MTCFRNRSMLLLALLVQFLFLSVIAHTEQLDGMTVTYSERFQLRTEFDDPDWSKQTLLMLEDCLDFYEKQTGNKWPKDEKISANVYCTDKLYVAEDVKRTGGGYRSVWAYNWGKSINVIIRPRWDENMQKLWVRSPVTDALLCHETLHALDMRSLPKGAYFPYWMLEGRAEYYSRLYRDTKGIGLTGDLWYSRHIAKIRDEIAVAGVLPYDLDVVLKYPLASWNPFSRANSYAVVFTLYCTLKADKSYSNLLGKLESELFRRAFDNKSFQAIKEFEKLHDSRSKIAEKLTAFVENSRDEWSELSVCGWVENDIMKCCTFPSGSAQYINRYPMSAGSNLKFKLRIHADQQEQASIVFGFSAPSDYYVVTFKRNSWVMLSKRVPKGWDSTTMFTFTSIGTQWADDFNDISLTFCSDKVDISINEKPLTISYKDGWALPAKWRWGVFVYDSFADYSPFEMVVNRE